MNLLYDLTATQPNTSGKFHGGGKYAIVVFFELLKRNINIECVWNSSKYMREDIVEICEKNSIILHDVLYESLENIIDNSKYDIYYSALAGIYPWFANKQTKYVGTIHGLRGLETPNDIYSWIKYNLSIREKAGKFFNWLTAGKRQKKYTDAWIMQENFSFITVSKHTKNSILAYYPSIKEKDIKVFYSPSTSINRKDTKPYSLEKYFLMVSGNRPEKNVLRALLALDELFSERKEFVNFRVYVTGATSKSYKCKFVNKDKFYFLNYVSEDVLDSLYAGAFCFIYPSLNEGFGYPPIEAMNYNVPVLASPFSSIYEVCNNAAIYFNPFSVKEIKARILEIVSDFNLYNEMCDKGKQRFDYISQRQSDDLKALVDHIIGLI
ncbi:MAG: glycosyltransferase family 4 protein [Prevotellaceae bacterium]|nr:glycosyltransferase family 4 protein [Prevotellaceae bacterium]